MNLDCCGDLVELEEGEAASTLKGSAQGWVAYTGFVREGANADVLYDECVGDAGSDLKI